MHGESGEDVVTGWTKKAFGKTCWAWILPALPILTALLYPTLIFCLHICPPFPKRSSSIVDLELEEKHKFLERHLKNKNKNKKKNEGERLTPTDVKQKNLKLMSKNMCLYNCLCYYDQKNSWNKGRWYYHLQMLLSTE